MNKDTYCHYPFKAIAIKDYKGDKLRSFWPCCMMGNDRESHNINAFRSIIFFITFGLVISAFKKEKFL